MKALIVIDMQNDFLTGSLANQNGVEIIPNVINEINKDYDVVIATKDTHYDETTDVYEPEGAVHYNDSLEGKNLPVPHCIKFTKGWEIEPSILEALKAKKEKFHTIEKLTFGWSGWKKYFEKWDIEEITICGVVTSICVIANAVILRAMYPNMKINVIANACAGLGKEDHEAALAVMKCQQINVIE